MTKILAIGKQRLKILDLAKNDFFKLNLAQSDKNLEQKCFSADVNSFRNSLTRWLPKGYSETAPFMRFDNHFFWSQEFQKYLKVQSCKLKKYW